MYVNFFNPLYVTSDIQTVYLTMKNVLQETNDSPTPDNISALVNLIEIVTLSMQVPTYSVELLTTTNILNLLELAAIKLSKQFDSLDSALNMFYNELATKEHLSEIHASLSQNEMKSSKVLHRRSVQTLSVFWVLQKSQFPIFIQIFRILLLHYDSNRRLAPKEYFFYHQDTLHNQSWLDSLNFIRQQLPDISEELFQRCIDIIIFVNRQNRSINGQLIEIGILPLLVQKSQEPKLTKRCLILIRDLIQKHPQAQSLFDVQNTIEILFKIIKEHKNNQPIVQMVTQILQKLNYQPVKIESTLSETEDQQQSLQDQIDTLCFQVVSNQVAYSQSIILKLLKILKTAQLTQELISSCLFIFEKFLSELPQNLKNEVCDICYTRQIQISEQLIIQALNLCYILHSDHRITIPEQSLQAIVEKYSNNNQILRLVDKIIKLVRKAKRKQQLNHKQEQDEPEEYVIDRRVRYTLAIQQIAEPVVNFNSLSQYDSNINEKQEELTQAQIYQQELINATLESGTYQSCVDCIVSLSQLFDEDEGSPYLKGIFRVYLMFPYTDVTNKLMQSILIKIDHQSISVQTYEDLTTNLQQLACLSLFKEYYQENIIQQITSMIAIKMDSIQLRALLTIICNFQINQPNLNQYISQITEDDMMPLVYQILYQNNFLEIDIEDRAIECLEQCKLEIRRNEIATKSQLLLEKIVQIWHGDQIVELFEAIQDEYILQECRLWVLGILKSKINSLNTFTIISTIESIQGDIYFNQDLVDNILSQERLTQYFGFVQRFLIALDDKGQLIGSRVVYQLVQMFKSVVENLCLKNQFHSFVSQLLIILSQLQDPLLESILDHSLYIPALFSLISYAKDNDLPANDLVLVYQILYDSIKRSKVINFYSTLYSDEDSIASLGFSTSQLTTLTILILEQLVKCRQPSQFLFIDKNISDYQAKCEQFNLLSEFQRLLDALQLGQTIQEPEKTQKREIIIPTQLIQPQQEKNHSNQQDMNQQEIQYQESSSQEQQQISHSDEQPSQKIIQETILIDQNIQIMKENTVENEQYYSAIKEEVEDVQVPNQKKVSLKKIKTLKEVADALQKMVDKKKISSQMPQVILAIESYVQDDSTATRCHQLDISNRLFKLAQWDSLFHILKFRKASRQCEQQINFEIKELDLNILYIIKYTSKLKKIQAQINPLLPELINQLKGSQSADFIEIAIEILDAFCSQQNAELYYNFGVIDLIMTFIQKYPTQTYLLIGSICLSQQAQAALNNLKVYEIIEFNQEPQKLANAFYALSGLCFLNIAVSKQLVNPQTLAIVQDALNCPKEIVIETVCSFLSNLTYQNDQIKLQLANLTPQLIQLLQTFKKPAVLKQILRTIGNLCFMSENAQKFVQNNLLDSLNALTVQKELLYDIFDVFNNIGAHQMLKKEQVTLILGLLNKQLYDPQVQIVGMETLNTLIQQFSRQIIVSGGVVIIIKLLNTYPHNKDLMLKVYRVISNLSCEPQNKGNLQQVKTLIKPYNDPGIDHYYEKILKRLDSQDVISQRQSISKPEAVKKLMMQGYDITLYRRDGSYKQGTLKMLPSKELFVLQDNGVIKNKYRIKMIANVVANINFITQPEYKKYTKNKIFNQAAFISISGRYESTTNVINAQLNNQEEKQQLYDELMSIIK